MSKIRSAGASISISARTVPTAPPIVANGQPSTVVAPRGSADRRLAIPDSALRLV
jgi:hypothetical protein